MADWYTSNSTAVITGGAKGLGQAFARQFLADGLTVLIADRDEEALATAAETVDHGGRLHTLVADVTDPASFEHLADYAFHTLGQVNCLMNNAGAMIRTGLPWENAEKWQKQLDVNLGGTINGCHTFIPRMLDAGQPGVVINLGSKQGITNPPGSYAYNLSKAGIRTYTESTAHALRQVEGGRLSAHLLVPGFTYTPLVARFIPEKPDFAWTPEQVVEYALPRLQAGDFYVICPDNESPWELDRKRILWNTQDLTENRPALSRWHDDHKADFEAFVKGE